MSNKNFTVVTQSIEMLHAYQDNLERKSKSYKGRVPKKKRLRKKMKKKNHYQKMIRSTGLLYDEAHLIGATEKEWQEHIDYLDYKQKKDKEIRKKYRKY